MLSLFPLFFFFFLLHPAFMLPPIHDVFLFRFIFFPLIMLISLYYFVLSRIYNGAHKFRAQLWNSRRIERIYNRVRARDKNEQICFNYPLASRAFHERSAARIDLRSPLRRSDSLSVRQHPVRYFLSPLSRIIPPCDCHNPDVAPTSVARPALSRNVRGLHGDRPCATFITNERTRA